MNYKSLIVVLILSFLLMGVELIQGLTLRESIFNSLFAHVEAGVDAGAQFFAGMIAYISESGACVRLLMSKKRKKSYI